MGCVPGLRVAEISVDCKVDGQSGQVGVLLPVLLLPMSFSSPLASPSCLTPMEQHLPGGLDAIVFEMFVW